MKGSPTETEPPLPLPNQTTIDKAPTLPPACKTAVFEAAQKIRKRFLKQLQPHTPEVRSWILASLAADFTE